MRKSISFETEIERDSLSRPVSYLYTEISYDAVRDPHAVGDSEVVFDNVNYDSIIMDGEDITNSKEGHDLQSYLWDEASRMGYLEDNLRGVIY